MVRGRARYVLVLVLLAAVGIGAWTWTRSDAARPALKAPPYEHMATGWNEVLAGENGLDEAALTRLDSISEGLEADDVEELKVLGRTVTVADLSGIGRGAYPEYWPPTATAGQVLLRCSHVEVEAVSPVRLPATGGGEYAKILVGWHAECVDMLDDHDHGPEGEEAPHRVAYVYATRDGETWKPVREWELPAPADEDLRVTAPPLEAELADLPGCDGEPSGEKARIVVVEAWKQLCAEAAAAGVDLEVGAGYRTPAEQAELFEEAQDVGSEKVAYSDGTTCDSKHCDGTAVDVTNGDGIMWLNDVVGCVENGRITLGPTSCNDQSIRRLQRYGFSAPDPGNLTHLEFVLPLGSRVVANCAPSRSVGVPEMVAQIFRCRLDREGIDPETTSATVAEALVISQCESLWNPRALALNGRFALAPDPVTGRKVTEAGVFMLPAELGKWAPEGDERLDPVKNINAAASLWLATRDWSQWECATGEPSPYATGPVLPEHGGPELPDWAFQY